MSGVGTISYHRARGTYLHEARTATAAKGRDAAQQVPVT